MSEDLKSFPLGLIKVGTSVMMLGSSELDKRILLQYLFYAHIGQTHQNGILIVKSKEKAEYNWHPEITQYNNFHQDIIRRMYQHQQIRTQKKHSSNSDMDNSSWVIFDDVLNKKEEKVKEAEEILTSLFVTNRRFDITAFVLSQSLISLTMCIRDNTDIFIMLADESEENRKKLWEMIPSIHSFQEFDQIFKQYTTNNRALVYLNFSRENNFEKEGNLFYIQIPDKLISLDKDGKKYFNQIFQVGSRELRKFNTTHQLRFVK